MELPDIGRRGCKLQLSSDTSRYAGTSLEVHDSPCHSGFLRLGLRQPLDRQACRNGTCMCARFDADRCDAAVVIRYSMANRSKRRANIPQMVGQHEDTSRVLPYRCALQGLSRGMVFTHSFLTDSGSVNSKHAIHFQDMEISTLVTFAAL